MPLGSNNDYRSIASLAETKCNAHLRAFWVFGSVLKSARLRKWVSSVPDERSPANLNLSVPVGTQTLPISIRFRIGLLGVSTFESSDALTTQLRFFS